MTNQQFPVLKYSLNVFINIRRIALITQHNIKIFLHNITEGFDFVTDKASQEFKEVHLTIPNKTPSTTPYTKADIGNGYVIPARKFIVNLKNANFFVN